MFFEGRGGPRRSRKGGLCAAWSAPWGVREVAKRAWEAFGMSYERRRSSGGGFLTSGKLIWRLWGQRWATLELIF